MSNPKLRVIKDLVLANKFSLSGHVREAVETGEFDEDAIKHSILNAQQISSRKDEKRTALDGRKYVLTGPDRAGLSFRTVGKIQEAFEGKDYLIIAAFGVN